MRASVPRPLAISVATTAVLTLVLMVAPPMGSYEAVAIPRTVMSTLDGLPSQAADEGGVTTFGAESAGGTSRQVPTDMPFSMVGFELPRGVDEIEVRTSADGDEWSDWAEAAVEELEAPDAVTGEGRAAERRTGAVWTGEANHLQVRVEDGDPQDVEVTLIDSLGLSGGEVDWHLERREPAAEASEIDDVIKPDIVTRGEWGASSYKGTPDRVKNVHMGVVHHTAGSNDYSESEAPAVVRGIQSYHQNANGWDDIGYNFLVDRYGNIYEGRDGGMRRGVIGAHAYGYNTHSFGVSVMGNFEWVDAPRAAIDAVVDVVAWKSAVHGFDPDGYTRKMDGKLRHRVLGHRNVGSTSCPTRIQGDLPEIRERASHKSFPFTDVPGDSRHREPIRALYYASITKGCTSTRYCPLKEVTRAQASTLIAQTLGIDKSERQQFSDVPAESVHAGYINAMAEEGIINGYDDGTFGPKDPITRGQLATIVGGALGLDESDNPHFDDVQPGHTHYGYVSATLDVDITDWCGSFLFCPQDNALRDAVATFVDGMRRYDAK